MYPYFFDLTSFKRLGQKSLQKFHWFFGRFEDTKMIFQNQLTFNYLNNLSSYLSIQCSFLAIRWVGPGWVNSVLSFLAFSFFLMYASSPLGSPSLMYSSACFQKIEIDCNCTYIHNIPLQSKNAQNIHITQESGVEYNKESCSPKYSHF